MPSGLMLYDVTIASAGIASLTFNGLSTHMECNESTTAIIAGNIVDETGAAIGSGSITAATYQIKDLQSGSTVLASTSCASSISAGGALSLTITAAQNALVNTSRAYPIEWREILFTISTATRSMKFSVKYGVRRVYEV